jgi:hypothetical protein
MGAWAVEQVTVGATDHSFVHSRHEVKFGVVPKAPVSNSTAGHA